MNAHHRIVFIASTIVTTIFFIGGVRCEAESSRRQRETSAQSAGTATREPQMLAMAESRCVADKELQAAIRAASEDKLRAGLRNRDACIRKSVVQAIGKSGDDAWLDDLRAACEDKDAGVRASAAVALARVLEANRSRGFKDADARFVQSLIGLLQDRSQDVRRAAAQSLQYISGMDLDYSPAYWKAWWEDGVSLRKG